MKTIMTKSELAQEWGVNLSRISNLLSDGSIIENSDGKIDFRMPKNREYLEARQNRKTKASELKLIKDKNLQKVLEKKLRFLFKNISEDCKCTIVDLITTCEKYDISDLQIIEFLIEGLNKQLKNSLKASRKTILTLLSNDSL